MTPIRSLNPFFYPRSIAVVGASDRAGSVGAQVFQNLLSSGFAGPVYAVNRKHAVVQGKPAVPSVKDIEGDVQLAVIATPAETVAGVLEACADKRVEAALVLSSGFAEAGPAGEQRQRRLLDTTRRRGVRILGPNCLGVICTGAQLNATFSKGAALAGDLALVSQSGALCTAILDWATPRGIGFSSVVSIGDAADVDFGELLDYLALDKNTSSILLYVEGVRDARRFVSGLRAAARLKPVVVLKSGRRKSGIRAALSHTGALAGADDAFEAALERAGAVRVQSIGQLFALAQMLAAGSRSAGDRLAIVSNAGGPAVMASDRADELGVQLAQLETDTIAALDAVLPPQWSHENPVDVLGDATPERYGAAIERCLADAEVDAVLTILTPQAMTEPLRVAEHAAAAARSSRKPVIACFMGEQQVSEARSLLSEERVPQFHTPEAAVDAFYYLSRYRKNQAMLLEVPGPLGAWEPPDVDGARLIVEGALAERRENLTQLESRALLKAFRLPVLPATLARTSSEALVAAESAGFPVALKIDSPDISHKSDVGGVVLNVGDANSVRSEFNALLEHVKALRPDADVRGVIVEAMCKKPNARELIAGSFTDPAFGPVVSFGAGGVAVELLRDRAVVLPPLNPLLADALIGRTRVARLLQGYRNLPPVDLLALRNLLLRISELVCELPHVVELDINPLLADEAGVLAVDARVRVHTPKLGTEPYRHLAIHPYPAQLVSRYQLADGKNVTIRPIRPEDASIEAEFVKKLSQKAKYFRFMHMLEELTPSMLARLTQIDYDREMALIATVVDGGREIEIGVARYYTNPDGQSCEFALVVADAWQHRGIGSNLMDRLMRVALAHGLREMSGIVLRENADMLALMDELGFARSPAQDDPAVVVVTRALH